MKTQISLLDGAHLPAVERLNCIVENFDFMTHYMHDKADAGEIMSILIARGMHDTARRLAECLDEMAPEASKPAMTPEEAAASRPQYHTYACGCSYHALTAMPVYHDYDCASCRREKWTRSL